MSASSGFQPYLRSLHLFARTRSLEVLLLQASPFLGACLAVWAGSYADWSRLFLLLAGSFALTAHVFVFNDWAGRVSDLTDSHRAHRLFGRRGITSRQVAKFSIALLVAANIFFALAGRVAVILGAAIAALGIVYSCSASFGKGRPLVASAIHVLGGALHFLLGYSLFRAVDLHGWLIGFFFGLIFAAGHLNQEVRDHEADARNGIRTTAVVFGCARAFFASQILFLGGYVMLTALAALSILPATLLWSVLLWPLHLPWSFRSYQRGLGFESALWMQRRYRTLFALLGLAIFLAASR